MWIRQSVGGYGELKNILIADAVLIIAFAFTLSGGLEGLFSGSYTISHFAYILPMVALAVTLTFVLHEMMHKFVAQRYGAIAGFQASYTGLIITGITGVFGFLLGIPGATVIYTSSFTKRQNGLVSLAGPITNFVVFGIFLSLLLLFGNSLGHYLTSAFTLTLQISIMLAFFNMLPIYPLDGSKVLAWSLPIYAATLAVIFVLAYITSTMSIMEIAYMVVVAAIFSLFWRRI